MSKKLYWGLVTLILLIIGAFVFLIVKNQLEIRQLEREAAEAQKWWQQRNAQQEPQGKHPAQGHFHEDGTFHASEPPDPIQTKPAQVPRDFTPAQVQIPEGITDPDVLAAWERVDYIANNIWEWGGVPSNRAVQLIDQLMPPPDEFSGPSAHGDAEETINLLGELAWSGDPRAAEVVATYYCNGIIGGNDPIDALVEIGPPSVPYILHYLNDDTSDPGGTVRALGEIAVKYREDLVGIVEHIIIPRLEEIAAIDDPPTRMVYPKVLAQEALSRLK